MLYDPNWQKPEETTTEEWRVIVGKAADLIERVGWTQKKYEEEIFITERRWFRSPKIRTETVGYCIVGAIRHVIGSDDEMIASDLPRPKHWRIADQLSEEMGVGSIAGWNDEPERTKEEVVSALRAIAKGHTAD